MEKFLDVYNNTKCCVFGSPDNGEKCCYFQSLKNTFNAFVSPGYNDEDSMEEHLSTSVKFLLCFTFISFFLFAGGLMFFSSNIAFFGVSEHEFREAMNLPEETLESAMSKTKNKPKESSAEITRKEEKSILGELISSVLGSPTTPEKTKRAIAEEEKIIVGRMRSFEVEKQALQLTNTIYGGVCFFIALLALFNYVSLKPDKTYSIPYANVFVLFFWSTVVVSFIVAINRPNLIHYTKFFLIFCLTSFILGTLWTKMKLNLENHEKSNISIPSYMPAVPTNNFLKENSSTVSN
jgi:hypothetical protein